MTHKAVDDVKHPTFVNLLALVLKTTALSFESNHGRVRCVFDYHLHKFHKIFAQAKQRFCHELPELEELRFGGGYAFLYSYNLADTVDFLRQTGVIEIFSRQADTFEVFLKEYSKRVIEEKIQQFFGNDKKRKRAFLEFADYIKENLLLEVTAEIKLYPDCK